MSDEDDGGRDVNGRFTKNNEWWRVAIERGLKPLVFESPEALFEYASGYFEWLAANPLIEIDFKGKDAEEVEVPKMRAPTIKGLCAYIGITQQYWQILRKDKPDLSEPMRLIEQIIYQMKFEGAAAGFFKEAIIARDLGLADRSELTGPNGDPIQVQSETSDFDIARKMAFLLAQAAQAKLEEKT